MLKFEDLRAFLVTECRNIGLIVQKFLVIRSSNNRFNLDVIIEKINYEVTGFKECGIVNKIISLWLKNENMTSQVNITVRVPGIDRELFSLQDCERFCGSCVSIELKTPIDDTKKIKGFIKSLECDLITLESGNKMLFVQWDNIKKAKLIPDWAEVMKRVR